MRNFKTRIIDSGSSQNPFLAMTEAGVQPEEIKQFVIDTLLPYFENHDIVKELAIDVLAPEVVNIYKTKLNPPIESGFNFVLQLYRRAKLSDERASLNACADAEVDISAGLSHYWSCMYLEQEKADLEIHEFAFECFRLMGTLIEACIQPFLRDLLRQTRIVRGKSSALPTNMSLGNLVGELFDTLGFPELMAPSPWGIRLNQWRNIAQHHRTRIEAGRIVGTYGEHPNEQEISLSRSELMEALRTIAGIFNAIKLARTIYFIDNLHKLKPLLRETNLREDDRLLSLVTAISSQGFRVSNIHLSESEATLELSDLQSPSEQRVIHASQFLLRLWAETKRASLKVVYSNQAGDYVAEFETTGEACSLLDREETTIEQYLQQVSFKRRPT
ncbi:hypothetical protein OF113_08315 [Ectopseudomonas chengduensis]|nr:MULTISPECIES: hypothetical protein [Pseudomonas]MDZ4191141.1 hypothetical protein [Pseudomonas sp.]UZT80043.1 hypothetical protein OF113_08315 [Pseudomonas chengduensis]